MRQRLDPAGGRRGALGWRPTGPGGTAGRAPHLGDLGRFVGRPPTTTPPPPTPPPDDEGPSTAAAQAPR